MKEMNTRSTRPLTRILFAAGTALVVLSSQAPALDFTPDASRVLSDPAYLPLEGKWYGQTAYSYGRTSADVDNYLGAPNRSFVTTSNALSQVLVFGVTDDLSLRISESYAQNNTTNNFATGTSASSNALGFSDPILGATWRVLDQRQHAVSWDLIGSYMPDMIQAIGAAPTQDGTVARGGQVATLGTAVSYKTKDFTLYLDAAAAYLGKRAILNANNTTTNYQANRQYSLGVNTQTRLCERSALNFGVSRTFNNSVNATNDTTLATFTSRPGNVSTVSAALLYHITPNRLVAALAYSHDIYSTSSVTYPTLPASSTTTRNQKGNAVGVRLQYVFD